MMRIITNVSKYSAFITHVDLAKTLRVHNFVFADMQKLRTVIKPKLRPRSAPKTRVVNPAPQMVDTIIIKPQSKVKTTNNKINNYN